MSGEFTIRQGTIYERADGTERRLIVNHNPMQLQALELRAAGADAPFDFGTLRVVALDELIELRRSADWRDRGDLPPEAFQAVLETLLELPGLPEPIQQLLQTLRA